ncbi:MAG: osmoprotectant NAGGN system M42 family peptidase [Desulforhopalus sp.]
MITQIDKEYLTDILRRLLITPSPSGMTDEAVRLVCDELDSLSIPYKLTRRGAIRAKISGKKGAPARAVVGHLDTLGAMVKSLKRNGRMSLVPIGTWSSRFAEGARVVIHADSDHIYEGTVLPLKASGHRYNEEIDNQPTTWSNLEIRLDEICSSLSELWDYGIRVGDFVSFKTEMEMSASGFLNSRFLDDKAGVASMLAAANALKRQGTTPKLDCSLLFTISEEVGVGASHVLRGDDVAEMVSIDNGTIAPDQNTCEFGVTLAMKDSSGPFDIHLTKHLLNLCIDNDIEFSRDIFLHYRSDAAAALEAGNDIRTALVCFGLDASHGYERTHITSLTAVAALIALYISSPPLFESEENVIGLEKEYPLIKSSLEKKPV